MGLEVNFTKKQKHLEIQFSGTYDPQESINKFLSAILTSCQSGFDKVLIDYRQLEVNIAATEKFISSMPVKEHYQNHLCTEGQLLQVAYVGKPSKVSDGEPFLNIAKAEGLPFTLAKNIKEAKSWLGV